MYMYFSLSKAKCTCISFIQGLETASISGKSALASNVFKNLKIDKEDLVQKLPNDWDTKSAITSTSLKGLHLKKKDRKKLRHELLVQSKFACNVFVGQKTIKLFFKSTRN